MKKNGKWAIYFKQYLKVDNNNSPIERSHPYQNLILEDAISSARGTKEVMDLFSEKKFDYPKPLNLLSTILKMCGTCYSTVLDFFAGSGTTLHATFNLMLRTEVDAPVFSAPTMRMVFAKMSLTSATSV